MDDDILQSERAFARRAPRHAPFSRCCRHAIIAERQRHMRDARRVQRDASATTFLRRQHAVQDAEHCLRRHYTTYATLLDTPPPADSREPRRRRR